MPSQAAGLPRGHLAVFSLTFMFARSKTSLLGSGLSLPPCLPQKQDGSAFCL